MGGGEENSNRRIERKYEELECRKKTVRSSNSRIESEKARRIRICKNSKKQQQKH